MNTEPRKYDKKGRPIYPGDLLKTDHFVGRNRKRYYLYHTVVLTQRGLEMVPAAHLEPTKVKGGGRAFLASMPTETESEIIEGHGPGDYLSFEDRPRRKAVESERR